MHSDKILTVVDLITFLVLALLIIVLFEFVGPVVDTVAGD